MKEDLRDVAIERRDQSESRSFIDGPRVGEPAHLGIVANTRALETPPDQCEPRGEAENPHRCREACNRRKAPRRAPRLRWQSYGRDAELGRQIEDDTQHGRMQNHVTMRVDMIERESGGPKRLELSSHLGAQRAARGGSTEIPEPRCDQAVRQPASWIDDRPEPIGCENSPTIDHHHVEAHPQAGGPSRGRHRVRGGWFGNHETRRRQDALTVRLFNRCVDGGGQAEVIGGDDDAKWTGPSTGTSHEQIM